MRLFKSRLFFDLNKKAELLLNDYRNRLPVKDFKGSETLLTAKHILCAQCDEVGFIVGGDEIEIAVYVGKNDNIRRIQKFDVL